MRDYIVHHCASRTALPIADWDSAALLDLQRALREGEYIAYKADARAMAERVQLELDIRAWGLRSNG